jgi:hypothetical protein
VGRSASLRVATLLDVAAFPFEGKSDAHPSELARHLLQSAQMRASAACLAVALLAGCQQHAGPGTHDSGTTPVTNTPIGLENALAGATGWRLAHATDAMAFTDATSYAPGDTVHLHAAAAKATAGTWQLWRLGYYRGDLGRLMTAGARVEVPVAPAPVLDRATGELRAPYPEVLAIPLAPDQLTGVYLIKLVLTSGESYATFVVRERQPRAPN